MRKRFALTVAAAFALMAAACTAGGGGNDAPETVDPNAEHDPVTLEMWIPFSAEHEVAGVQATFDAFEAEYPWITMNITTGVEDDAKTLAAIRAGEPPDAVMSWALDDLAAFCDTGAWQDLSPFIQQDGMVVSDFFPPSVERYTGFGGKQCAFPFLTDAVGLYYNKDLLEAKGFTEPPKTYSELTEMAKALTEFNPDGSIKVAGFIPWFGNYYVNGDPLNHSIAWDADWYNDDGTAAMATDPDWAAMFRWQKDLVDWYGVDKLKQFIAGQGDEWGEASQDFQLGRLAMALDGEWRTAFIENGTPDLNYDTAPAPVPDDQADTYGIGRVGGTIIGIPRGSAHEAEAWLLVKFMATNTDSLVAAANAIGNVPTTFDSLESSDLSLPDQFATFLDVFENPGSHYKDMSILGSADQDILTSFAAKWQSGRITDLEAGLAQVAQQIDDQLEQAGG
ncbi:MAG TPA: extracellular solute-binding protein [Actinomycetota bacterium]|nr:extracellular solute-binding protein [Actinomycetota bacterium]